MTRSLAAIMLALAIPSAAEARDVTVTMANMSYGSIPANLMVGDTITWVNNDTVAHTVTARDHSFDLRLAPKGSQKQVLQTAGSFPFFCIYHSMMRGTLKVAEKK